MTSELHQVPNESVSLLPSCPSGQEESWRRSDAKSFFLPLDEALSASGSPLLGPSGLAKFSWHVRDVESTAELSATLSRVGKALGFDLAGWHDEHAANVSVVVIGPGKVEVFRNVKSGIQFSVSSSVLEPEAILPGSAICLGLAQRLHASVQEEIVVEVSSSNNDKSILLVVNDGDGSIAQSYSSLKVVAKSGSRFALAVIDGTNAFSHHRHELVIEENARVAQTWLHASFAKDETKPRALLERKVVLAPDARFLDAEVFRPSGNARIISNVFLMGKGAVAKSAAAVIATGTSFVDYEPVQTHLHAGGSSSLKVKILADDDARVAFQGLVDVAKPAVNTVAVQDNKNLLLSKTAKINASPRLQILPDDVQCKHGSATGEMDPRQLYYLTSRGFSAEEARALIVRAFVTDSLSVLAGAEEDALVAIAEKFLSR